VKRILLVLSVLVLLQFPLIAQERDFPRHEVYAGYQDFFEIFGADLHGAKVEYAYNLTPIIGIIGEFGFGLESEHKSLFGGTVNDDTKEYIFLAGPRFSYRINRFRIFAHGLAGGTVMSGDASEDEFSEGSLGGVALDLGLGAEISVTKLIAIRPLQFDWIGSRFNVPQPFFGEHEIDWKRQLRYTGGIVFRFAGK
jgi:hypothetical protein